MVGQILFFFLLVLSVRFVGTRPLSRQLSTLLRRRILGASRINVTMFSLAAKGSICHCRSRGLCHPTSIRGVVASIATLTRLKTSCAVSANLHCHKGVRGSALGNDLCLVNNFSPRFVSRSLSHLMSTLTDRNVHCIASALTTSISVASSIC